MHRAAGRLTAAAALAFALAAVSGGNAIAAPGDAASAPDGAAVSYAAGSQITVKPGQSLNDIAIAVTQSHDRATLARASRAMFDANPNAFMNHDPSRLRMGAALTVPALDATGAAASAGSTPVVATSSAVAGSAPVVAAAVPVSTPNAAAAGGVASSVAQVNAAAASAASAASAAAATSATPAVAGTASAAAEAAPVVPGSAVSSASAPVAGSQAAAPASGTHEWSGSIQSSASEAGQGASASAGTAAATASQARVQVSSLQQLLALKNRVLMELQKHGIGGSAPVPAAAVATSGAQAAVGASSAAAVSGQPGAATSTANATGMSETSLSVAAAIGAALVVLLAALRMGRRKRAAAAAAAAAEGSLARDAALAAANASAAQDVMTTREASPVDGVTDVSDEVAVRHAATEREAAENDAARVTDEASVRHAATEHDATYSDAATRETAERQAELRVAAERAAAEHTEAERAAAERAAAEHAERAAPDQSLAGSTSAHDTTAAEAVDHPSEQAAFPAPDQQASQDHAAASAHDDAPHSNPDTTEPPHTAAEAEPLPAEHHENLEGATTAASLAAAAELGADALPLTSLEPVDETFEHEEPQHLQWDDEPAPSAEPAEPHHEYAPPPIPVEQTQHAPKAPTEFPRDALDAFNSLDMPLPPRIESDDDLIGLPPLTTHPVASPESTARHAVAPHDPQDAPHIADEIAAGTAGAAAVAGLGAAGFGALKLDFDLELPPSPAQPLPAFTQADLGRIARNKLDLAAEYIDLGDLAGARTLINEVIEANDPATRTEARALLSTLAPLS